jgi:hypothetical protein
MFRRGCTKRQVAPCDCLDCQKLRVDEQEDDRQRRYAEGLQEERRALVFRFEQAIALGDEVESIPDPLQPIGRLVPGSKTGTELAREMQGAIAAVDAELARVGA